MITVQVVKSGFFVITTFLMGRLGSPSAQDIKLMQQTLSSKDLNGSYGCRFWGRVLLELLQHLKTVPKLKALTLMKSLVVYHALWICL